MDPEIDPDDSNYSWFFVLVSLILIELLNLKKNQTYR